MMDDADMSDARIEAAIEMAVTAARNAPRELQPCGVCHWCGELLRQHNQLFCDALCENDWESNRQRNGVAR